MPEKKLNLVKFDSLSGVPCFYAPANSAYANLKKCRKSRVRKLNPTFLRRLQACITELELVADPTFGTLKAITSGGAYVDKPGWHSKGKAYDLGGLHWGQAKLTTLEMARAYHFNALSKIPYRFYLGCEAILRRHFGTVLGIHFNPAHYNHWHIDPGTKVGYWPKGFGANTRVKFLQEALTWIWQVECGATDGDEGKKTRKGIKEIRERLFLGPLTDQSAWMQFLLLSALKTFGSSSL